MTADTITIDRITELATALGIAYAATQRLAASCHRGEVSPKEAAAEINETFRLLAIAAK
jgi:hypothetical protein